MQREYTASILKGRPGMLFGSHHEIEAMFLKSGIVPFGYGVKAGTEEQEALLPGGGETVADFRGVARLAKAIERLYKSENNPTYDSVNNDVMDIVRKGKIIVIPTSLVLRDGPIFWQRVTSGNNFAGTFRDTADGGNAIDISTVASWFRANETIGDIAVLDLHIER